MVIIMVVTTVLRLVMMELPLTESPMTRARRRRRRGGPARRAAKSLGVKATSVFHNHPQIPKPSKMFTFDQEW